MSSRQRAENSTWIWTHKLKILSKWIDYNAVCNWTARAQSIRVLSDRSLALMNGQREWYFTIGMQEIGHFGANLSADLGNHRAFEGWSVGLEHATSSLGLPQGKGIKLPFVVCWVVVLVWVGYSNSNSNSNSNFDSGSNCEFNSEFEFEFNLELSERDKQRSNLINRRLGSIEASAASSEAWPLSWRDLLGFESSLLSVCGLY